MERINIWENTNNDCVYLDYYKPIRQTSNTAMVIFPGGAYTHLAEHEGRGYAEMFNLMGIPCFVLNYRVAPNRFPTELQDARRSVQFVRKNCEKFGISKDKVLVIGSSAGGHLTALLSTFKGEIESFADEISLEDYVPNAQILCYPVISSDESVFHKGSFESLLGERYFEKDKFSVDLLVDKTTPKAFIWHTSEDNSVNVINSFRYATALRNNEIPFELHVFPHGAHGLAYANSDNHVAQWVGLLKNWLILNKYL